LSHIFQHRLYNNKQEIWDRAQLEADWLRKTDWKYNLEGCMACKNLRGQQFLRAEIIASRKKPSWWVNMHAYDFFVCGPKFTKFLTPKVRGVVVDRFQISVISIYCGVIRALSKSKVSEIAPNFRRFYPPKFCWRHPSNIVPPLSRLPRVTSPNKLKFRKVSRTAPKVIGAHMWNFLSPILHVRP